MQAELIKMNRDYLQETIDSARRLIPKLTRTPYASQLSIELGAAYKVLGDQQADAYALLFATFDLAEVMRRAAGYDIPAREHHESGLLAERGQAAVDRYRTARARYNEKRIEVKK